MDEATRMAWLTRLERWTEWPKTLLAIALIPILLAPYLFSLSADSRGVLTALYYLIWGVFALDLVVCLAIAPRRLRYLRSHWFDVVLVVLPMLRPFGSLRLLRAVGAVAAADRSFVGIRRLARRRGLNYVLAVALVVVVCAGSLVTVFERNTPDATITSLPDGLWWAVTTITTVGYGDTFPRTSIGRGIGVALMLLGVALFGLITANLAALFVEEQESETLVQLRQINERLARLEASLPPPASERHRDMVGLGPGREPDLVHVDHRELR